AIDLIDEAAAMIRTEIDSQPYELDKVNRQIMQAEIEREALRKEDDAASRERLSKLEDSLTEMKIKQSELAQIEKTRIDIEEAQRKGDLGRASELTYSVLPGLESQLAAISNDIEGEDDKVTADSKRLLKEFVGPDDIAGIISRWTGIPVSRLVEGER
ncbi:ATP-dependent chaperone ClpB, partial [Aduncisulcus paluster]